MGRFPLQEPVMRRVNLAGFTLLALGLATGLVVVSCQDQRSVTEAPRAPRADAIAGSATAVISPDRRSTRLNSSHSQISYAVFCLKKKKTFHNSTSTVQDIDIAMLIRRPLLMH